MRLERTYDMELVELLVNHPTVVNALTSSEGWNSIADDGVTHFMLVFNNENDVVGLFIAAPFNAWTYNVHSLFLPEAYRFGTIRAANLLKDYLFNDVGALKVITQVPTCNDLARGYAKNTGMVYEGTMRQAYMKGGCVYDLLMYGLTKEEYYASNSVDRRSSSSNNG